MKKGYVKVKLDTYNIHREGIICPLTCPTNALWELSESKMNHGGKTRKKKNKTKQNKDDIRSTSILNSQVYYLTTVVLIQKKVKLLLMGLGLVQIINPDVVTVYLL